MERSSFSESTLKPNYYFSHLFHWPIIIYKCCYYFLWSFQQRFLGNFRILTDLLSSLFHTLSFLLVGIYVVFSWALYCFTIFDIVFYFFKYDLFLLFRSYSHVLSFCVNLFKLSKSILSIFLSLFLLFLLDDLLFPPLFSQNIVLDRYLYLTFLYPWLMFLNSSFLNFYSMLSTILVLHCFFLVLQIFPYLLDSLFFRFFLTTRFDYFYSSKYYYNYYSMFEIKLYCWKGISIIFLHFFLQKQLI